MFKLFLNAIHEQKVFNKSSFLEYVRESHCIEDWQKQKLYIPLYIIADYPINIYDVSDDFCLVLFYAINTFLFLRLTTARRIIYVT